MQSSSLEHKQKTPEGYIHFGSLSGVFGVQGEAKFFLNNLSTTLFDQWIVVYSWQDRQIGSRYEIKLRRGGGKKVLGRLRFEGQVVTDTNIVRDLIGTELLISESDLPSLDEEEFYHHQLLGLVVENQHGDLVGTIIEITPGTVDVLTIKTHSENEYIPFIASRVLDISSEKIVVSLPDRD
mgnify:CR=1 FL=1